MTGLKLTKEIFAIPYGENYIVYAPLRGVVILCNPAMVSSLQHLHSDTPSVLDDPCYAEFIDSLQKAGLLIECGELEQEAKLLTTEPTSFEFSPTRLTFLVTTNCNLRCVYCYASAGERHVTIPFQVCKAAIDFAVSNAVALEATDCHIAFHGGGEPTTAFPLVRKCVEYAREQAELHGILSSFSIVTNGILTEYQIKWLAANMNGISVSLDGPADIQNNQRPLRNGQGSFDVVFRTIKKLEQLGVSPFVRATITNESVARMGEISRFFAENFETPEFQLEPMAVCGRCATTECREPTVEEFVDGVENAMEEAAKLGKRAVCSAALETFPNLMEAYCGVAAPNFAITPEGAVTACYEVSLPSDPRGEFFYYGRYNRVKQRFLFDDNAIQRLRSYVVQNIQRCRDCFCRWQCAGDCPVRSVWRLPIAEDTDDVDFRCQMTRELVRRRLVRALENQPVA
jgi:uncharacterized protein